MKYLVITTINGPDTGSIAKLRSQLDDWAIIVVGDKKTPNNWEISGVRYLSVDEQMSLFPDFAKMLPFNSYARKNLGYLYAIRNGAEIIAETDDDNFAYDWYLKDIRPTVLGSSLAGSGWINVYSHFTDQWIWPRGFALNRLLDNNKQPAIIDSNVTSKEAVIQQYLADGDSDVDAIYRLALNDNVKFKNKSAVFLENGQTCPFNSQNTVWMPKAFNLLYLPSFVSFRMTDIWRSFVATRCVHAMQNRVAFLSPTVFQERNIHDFIVDFKQEIDGYIHNDEIVQCLARLDLNNDSDSSLSNMIKCYEALHSQLNLITSAELKLIEQWCLEVAK
jgi:hypothetical protein